MIKLNKISLYQLPELIKLSYENDLDLLQHFHIAPMSLEQAIVSTFGMIQNASKIKPLKYYEVIYQNHPIGYVVTYENNVLYSYAIAKRYRKKEVLMRWWDEVKSILDKEFTTMLYGNNHRAADFLLRNNMALIGNENNVLTFINNTK